MVFCVRDNCSNCYQWHTIEFLVEKNYSTETIMVYRGCIALCICLTIGLLLRQRQLSAVWKCTNVKEYSDLRTPEMLFFEYCELADFKGIVMVNYLSGLFRQKRSVN